MSELNGLIGCLATVREMVIEVVWAESSRRKVHPIYFKDRDRVLWPKLLTWSHSFSEPLSINRIRVVGSVWC